MHTKDCTAIDITNSQTLQAATTNSSYYINEVNATTIAALPVALPQKIKFSEIFNFGKFVLGLRDSTNSNVLAMGNLNSQNSETVRRFQKVLRWREGGW